MGEEEISLPTLPTLSLLPTLPTLPLLPTLPTLPVFPTLSTQLIFPTLSTLLILPSLRMGGWGALQVVQSKWGEGETGVSKVGRI